MRRRAAPETVAGDHAHEALALGRADDVDVILLGERVAENLVAGLELVALVGPDLHERPHRGDAGLLEVALRRGVRPAVRPGAHEADLEGVVAFLVGRLLLNDEAGPGLHDRDGHDCPIRREDLGHPHLLADDSVYGHGLLSERLDLDVHADRQLELHQRIHRL